MNDTACNNLFVYGTLIDLDFFKYMFKKMPEKISEGHIRANIYDCGTFPMVLEEPGGKVYGLIYTIEELEDILPSIDRYERFIPDDPEDSLFIRKKLSVTLSTDEDIHAWVYTGNTLSKFCAERCVEVNRIQSGRWKM